MARKRTDEQIIVEETPAIEVAQEPEVKPKRKKKVVPEVVEEETVVTEVVEPVEEPKPRKSKKKK